MRYRRGVFLFVRDYDFRTRSRFVGTMVVLYALGGDGFWSDFALGLSSLF